MLEFSRKSGKRAEFFLKKIMLLQQICTTFDTNESHNKDKENTEKNGMKILALKIYIKAIN